MQSFSIWVNQTSLDKLEAHVPFLIYFYKSLVLLTDTIKPNITQNHSIFNHNKY